MDNVKNRIMVDSPTNPKYKSVLDAYRQTWRETYNPSKGFGWNSLARVKNFYKVGNSVLHTQVWANMQGFVPVVLRAFPTNAAALAVWEGVMRYLNK